MTLILSLIMLGTPPGLVAEPATIDCGELKAGAPLEKAFKILNVSAQPIDISGVIVSCGCTRHTLGKARLGPGESTTLHVKIDTLAQAAGPWKWTATVNGTLTLQLTGTLTREITMTPPGLAMSFETGSITQEVLIHDTRAKPLQIKAIAASSSFLSATMTSEKPGQYRIRLIAKDSAAFGEHRETITLTTNDGTYPELRVPVTILRKRKQAFLLTPDEAVFHWKESQTSERLLLRRQDGQSLQIESCTTADDAVTIAWSKGSNTVATITLKAAERLKNQTGTAELIVRFSDPASEVLRIPIRWGD